MNEFNLNELNSVPDKGNENADSSSNEASAKAENAAQDLMSESRSVRISMIK